MAETHAEAPFAKRPSRNRVSRAYAAIKVPQFRRRFALNVQIFDFAF